MAKTATRKGVVAPAAPVGRPSTYDPETYPQRAYELCLLGLTDVQLSRVFEVSEVTLNAWKHAHPEFLKSLKEGKEIADGKVAASLYQRAMGYSHPDIDIRVIENEIVETQIIKHYPPDATSMIFWLKNRQPHLFRERTVTEVVGKDGGPIQSETKTTTNFKDLQAKVKAKREMK